MKYILTGKNMKHQNGFTLVELAVVLLIIGLLLVAILKAQELITNSQMTSTISEMELISGAVDTFVQNYGVYPGDMANAAFRIPGCDADPCNNGNGNGQIDVDMGVENTTSDEGAYFFNQLRLTGYLSNFDGQDAAQWGSAFPNTPIGGGFMVGDSRAGGTASGFDLTELRDGTYLILVRALEDVDADSGVLSPSQGGRIDRTLDDGLADSGRVVSQDDSDACRNVAADDEYEENSPDQVCVVAYRLPQL